MSVPPGGIKFFIEQYVFFAVDFDVTKNIYCEKIAMKRKVQIDDKVQNVAEFQSYPSFNKATTFS